MKLPSEIRLIDEKLKDAFYKLRIADAVLFRHINHAFDEIEKNAFCGIQVLKRLIPKEYGVKNLWKYNLPQGWRLLYSVVADEIIVVSIILEWLSHKDYERRFRY